MSHLDSMKDRIQVLRKDLSTMRAKENELLRLEAAVYAYENPGCTRPSDKTPAHLLDDGYPPSSSPEGECGPNRHQTPFDR